MDVTLPNGVVIRGVPDNATKDQIRMKAISSGLAVESDFPQISAPNTPNLDVPIDIPTPESIAATDAYYANRPKEETFRDRGLGENLLGGAEALLSIGSGMTTGLLGGVVGGGAGIGKSILTGQYGTNEGADLAEQIAMDSAASSTYQPRTKTGQEILAKLGQYAAPLAAIPPIAEVAALSQSVRPAIQSSASRVKAVAPKKDFKVDESLLYDNPEEAQRAALSRAMPVTKRIDPANPEKQINDDLAISAIRQGFDENFIQALKGLSPVDRKQVLKMATTIDRGENDYLISRYNRPSDVVGEALSNKVRFVKQKNEEAGSAIDKAASKLDGDIDFTDPVNSFLSDLDSLGVKLDENFTPNFKGSDTLGADRRVIREVLSRMKDAKDSGPKEAHKMKRFIDRMVTYGQTSQGSLGKDVSSSLKKLRSGLDERLDSAFPDYKAANDSYRETIQALDDYQQAAGKSIDIFSSDSAVGTRVVNALLSNQQGRENIQKAISQIDSVAKKHGGEFNDDILAQAAIANDLENIYKTQGKSSLGGIFARTADDIIDRGVMATAYKKGADIVRKSEKQRRQDSLKALKKLLMREEQ